MISKRRRYDLSSVSDEDAARYAPLVRALIRRKNYGDYLTYDEKFAAGLFGIVCGLQKFDATRGKRLESWLTYQANAQILTDVRREANLRRGIKTLADDAADSLVSRPQDDASQREEIKALTEALERLDERSRRVVQAIGIEGKKQREVAAQEGVSQSWISRIYRRSLETLRSELIPAS